MSKRALGRSAGHVGSSTRLETLEGRLLFSVDGIDWNGSQVSAFAGHFVVQMDGMSGAPADQLTAMNGELRRANARFHATQHLGSDGTFLLEDADQEKKGELKMNQAVHLLGQIRNFHAVEPDLYVSASVTTPNDPLFSSQWSLDNTGQTGGTPDDDIDAPEAWDLTTGSSSVVVGVVDTGIDYTHPDLDGNIWTNPGEVAGDGVDNDGNGYANDIVGWNFVANTNNPYDDNLHGTHVSGTIAATTNNGVGVAGIDWNARILPVKIFDSNGSGSNAWSISGVNYAARLHASVINASWGGGSQSQALSDAIANSGAVFVAASGNNGSNNDSTAFYPASYRTANEIVVASVGSSGALSSFSEYGGRTVDLTAPGESISSTIPGGYASMSGTSMATPHVSGVVALLASLRPGLGPVQLAQQVVATAKPLASLAGKTIRGRMVDADGAVTAALPSAPSARRTSRPSPRRRARSS
jgi:subtilisin family serine protease